MQTAALASDGYQQLTFCGLACFSRRNDRVRAVPVKLELLSFYRGPFAKTTPFGPRHFEELVRLGEENKRLLTELGDLRERVEKLETKKLKK
jgi:hypothetical protein